MKCESCGNNLNIEDEVCPYCGRPNPFALKHQRDMEHYSEEFTETKENVEKVTASFTGMIARITVVLALIVLTVIFTYLKNDGIYRIISSKKQSDIKRNEQKYENMMDSYESSGQWKRMADFYYDRQLSYDSRFINYNRVADMASDYWQIFFCLREYGDNRYHSGPSDTALTVAKSLEDAYSIMNRTDYSGTYYDQSYSAVHKGSMQRINSDINAVLITYADLSEDEIKRLADCSEIRKQEIITAGIRRLHGNETRENGNEE